MKLVRQAQKFLGKCVYLTEDGKVRVTGTPTYRNSNQTGKHRYTTWTAVSLVERDETQELALAKEGEPKHPLKQIAEATSLKELVRRLERALKS